jgi:hypothetical protein
LQLGSERDDVVEERDTAVRACAPLLARVAVAAGARKIALTSRPRTDSVSGGPDSSGDFRYQVRPVLAQLLRSAYVRNPAHRFRSFEASVGGCPPEADLSKDPSMT